MKKYITKKDLEELDNLEQEQSEIKFESMADVKKYNELNKKIDKKNSNLKNKTI